MDKYFWIGFFGTIVIGLLIWGVAVVIEDISILYLLGSIISLCVFFIAINRVINDIWGGNK